MKTISAFNKTILTSAMKHTPIFTICFFALFSVSLSAQRTNVWKGGAPGHENDWHYSKNWGLGSTHDVFDNVIIPDVSTTTNRYPLLCSGQIEIQSLHIQPGASLTLSGASEIVTAQFDGNGTCTGCEMRVRLTGYDKPAAASVSH